MIKQIPGFENYFADTEGNIYSNKKGEMIHLKLEEHKSGYYYVNLYSNGKRKHMRVHRLIALTFIDNPDNKSTVNHKDGNKKKNLVSNLEWATVSENTLHAFKNGLAKNDIGYDDSQSHPIIAIRLSDDEKFYYGSARQAAKALEVSTSTIMRQIKGKSKIDNRSKYKFISQLECNDYPKAK